MDSNGNRIYMSYDNYLKIKKNIPLYLATAEPYQVGNPQAELLDRNINLAQKNDLSRVETKKNKKIMIQMLKFIALLLHLLLKVELQMLCLQ